MTDVKTVTLAGGREMPLLGFGTWQITGRTAYEATLAALHTGYRHIDTATIYGNEAEVGRAVRDSGIPREEIFITTKVPPDRRSRERKTLDASLKALDTDYVDLWLIHWPPNGGAGKTMWDGMLKARNDGLARAVGVSNYTIAEIDELDEVPAVNQIPWSPVDYDPQTVAGLRERGIVLEGYSALKRTDLRHPVLTEIASGHGVTPAQVVLRWHLEHQIVVIPKSKTPARIVANFEIFGFSLSPAEVARIDGLSRSRD
jgi:2,5-diketo-D-gluconate reductase A